MESSSGRYSGPIEHGWAGDTPLDDDATPRAAETKEPVFSPERDHRGLRVIEGHREGQEGWSGPNPENACLKEIIVLAVGTGLRRNELHDGVLARDGWRSDASDLRCAGASIHADDGGM